MANADCRILCIDDHRDSAEMLRLVLSEEEYEVVTATTMAEAMERVATEVFDLYVLDRRLPDGTGLDLCKLLIELTPGVPCIFYTGDAYELHREQAFAAGAEGYVAKPNIEALIEAVHKLLENSECAGAGK